MFLDKEGVAMSATIKLNKDHLILSYVRRVFLPACSLCVVCMCVGHNWQIRSICAKNTNLHAILLVAAQHTPLIRKIEQTGGGKKKTRKGGESMRVCAVRTEVCVCEEKRTERTGKVHT